MIPMSIALPRHALSAESLVLNQLCALQISLKNFENSESLTTVTIHCLSTIADHYANTYATARCRKKPATD